MNDFSPLRSRRGLLAKPHRHVDALQIDETDVPLGASINNLLRWVRDRIGRNATQGVDWRSGIDGLRPYTQRLWHEHPRASKRRFLEHARAWWDGASVPDGSGSRSTHHPGA
ncbi:hypothetical protein IVB11_02000 [Bradyrhizobium sp. 177]|uniref:hypothetical protein n=1 Tax=Bradyrhizobium sp. 177 TaxID=2782647 RepID=UPI001FF98480|nr:hypothetical protein [Bradyrhizobium sp. 177]MCK1547854.1 hypothetical protein [Bradyrhizobium sp. 177]